VCFKNNSCFFKLTSYNVGKEKGYMIIQGVSITNEGLYQFSQDAAKELINELQRAVEESKDHNDRWVRTVSNKS
jgi:hypothetical protein